jgi:hypothetical protein
LVSEPKKTYEAELGHNPEAKIERAEGGRFHFLVDYGKGAAK